MPIRMRHNNDGNALCCNCGAGADKSLNMFDICIGKTIQTLCDVCNAEILNKTLSAEVFKNGRTKSSRDMQVIRSRHNGTYIK